MLFTRNKCCYHCTHELLIVIRTTKIKLLLQLIFIFNEQHLYIYDSEQFLRVNIF